MESLADLWAGDHDIAFALLAVDGASGRVRRAGCQPSTLELGELSIFFRSDTACVQADLLIAWSRALSSSFSKRKERGVSIAPRKTEKPEDPNCLGAPERHPRRPKGSGPARTSMGRVPKQLEALCAALGVVTRNTLILGHFEPYFEQ